jgi:hypothetical protein
MMKIVFTCTVYLLSNVVTATFEASPKSSVEFATLPLIIGRFLLRPLVLLAAAVGAAHATHHAAGCSTDRGTAPSVTADGANRGTKQRASGCTTNRAALLLRSSGRGGRGLSWIKAGSLSCETRALHLIEVLLIAILPPRGVYEQILRTRQWGNGDQRD